jgi:hypothetical protein
MYKQEGLNQHTERSREKRQVVPSRPWLRPLLHPHPWMSNAHLHLHPENILVTTLIQVWLLMDKINDVIRNAVASLGQRL